MYAYPTTINCMVRTPAHKMDKPALGRRLVARRAELGLSLARVEALTNGVVYDQLLFRLENGKFKPENLKVSQRLALAEVLQWTPEQLDEALEIAELSGSLSDTPEGISGEFRATRPTPGDRLRKLREERGLERDYVADHSEGAITARRLANLEDKPGTWERVRTEETHALAFVYEMKLSDFLEAVNGTKFPSKPNIYTDEAVLAYPNLSHGVRYVPVYNMAGMGNGGDDGDIIGYADIPEEWKGDHVGYKVFGESMSPEIRDGAIVIVKKQDRAAPGNDIICWTPDDGMLCKHLEKIEDGYHVLKSVNLEFKPIWAKVIKIYGIIVQSRNPHRVVNGNY